MPPLALAADQRSVNTGLATVGGFRPIADIHFKFLDYLQSNDSAKKNIINLGVNL